MHNGFQPPNVRLGLTPSITHEEHYQLPLTFWQPSSVEVISTDTVGFSNTQVFLPTCRRLASQSFFAVLTISDYANPVAPIAVPILYCLMYLCAAVKYPPPWYVAKVLTVQGNEYSQSNVGTTAKVMQITE